MSRRSWYVLIIVLLAAPLTLLGQKDKKSKRIADVITTAQFVYITTMDGESSEPTVSPNDRRAASALSEFLQAWGRYKVVTRKDDADIIMVVTTGRIGDVTAGGTVSAGTGREPRSGTAVRSSSGGPEDTLAVYSKQTGTDAAPLWRRSQIDGFVGGAPLFDLFKRDVETAAKEIAAKEAAKKK